MRDLALLLILAAYIRIALSQPWIGVLALSVVAYMQPQGYGGAAMVGFPYYLLLFVPVVIGYTFSPQ